MRSPVIGAGDTRQGAHRAGIEPGPGQHRETRLDTAAILPVILAEGDERPAEFHARLVRAPRTLRRSRGKVQLRMPRHYGRRLVALAAAVAVPAMAAPADWHGLAPSLLASGDSDQPAVPMPFERAGQSFPGSAFYYLEDAPKIAPEPSLPGVFDALNPFGGKDADDAALVQAHVSGPAARSFFFSGNGTDRMRAEQCLSLAVYYEAASESLEGQRAVAQVVLNRVAHPSYPDSVCGVVFQGSERVTGCQFSFTCDGSLSRKPSADGMARARMVARDALAGEVFRPIGLATHYHAAYVHPYWADSLDNVGRIGLHIFYRWRGAAGKSNAFSEAYRGGEPAAAPHPRSAVVESAAATDPVALARAFEEGRRKAEGEARSHTAGPPPAYSASVEARGGEALYRAENLPSASTVKAEYANSGRWIGQPGQAPAAPAQ
ncbi:MAG: cell wall hydrolase [Sphingomonadales bacterium]|nr:cell wall hydrolase [Sphingomonadales bacterium]MBD3774862.1 cell wall hydrolase [Paracoccaceae bacterium]